MPKKAIHYPIEMVKCKRCKRLIESRRPNTRTRTHCRTCASAENAWKAKHPLFRYDSITESWIRKPGPKKPGRPRKERKE